MTRSSDSFIGRGSHHAAGSGARMSINSRKDLGDASFIGRGSHHAAMSPRLS